MHDFLAHLIKHNALVQLLYRVVMSLCFKIIGIFVKIDEKLVLLSAYGGKQYSDSPKVLFEAMKQDERFADFHYVWVFEQPEKFDVVGAEKVKVDTLAYFIVALKAKIWITNVNIERGLSFKKKQTIYLNTWHGTGPKKGGNAVAGRKDYDFSRVDIFCTDGEYTTNVFKKYWNANERSMLLCGRPREDELLAFTDADRERIRENLKVPSDKQMILYMPTWREYENKELDYELWEQSLSDKYVMCVRTHHFAKERLDEKYNTGFWKDGTNYANVNELYKAADILISDYSSAFFDYGLLGKPMFCYAYDYERFKNETGLFMDLENEFPNGVIRDEQTLINFIADMDYEKECKKSSEYCASYVSHPVNATECCLNKLCEMLGN